MRGSRRRSGFTLLEILIVVTIIAILLGLLLPSLLRGIFVTKGAVATSEISRLTTALSEYEIERGDLPPSGNASLVSCLRQRTKDGPGFYMEFKQDALAGGTFRDPWGRPYAYTRLASPDANGRRFYAYSLGADGRDDTDDDGDGALSDAERAGNRGDDVVSF